MIPESYQPQTETSLLYLQSKLQQLQRVLDKNDTSKSRIFQNVDDLIKSVNPQHDKSDIREIIKHINNFIDTQTQKDSTTNGKDEEVVDTDRDCGLKELQELRLQNMKLRHIYVQKQQYYEEAIKVNHEYEDTINMLLEKFKSIKHEENINKINETRLKAIKLHQLEKDEFELFDSYLTLDQAINKLIRVVSDLTDIIGKNVDNDIGLISIYQMMHQLQFYQAHLAKKNEDMYFIEDFDKLGLDLVKS
ncbi:hypothetical protein WICPIJ_002903 [Wickerhamomyces pijperi]|uniref:Uncharacterized protein n=1 Tax=Wickerhamomyces pijperi TaxID=599730 RepID=A0A9P8TPE3_WICPI|nr:hypothetical protein WICPIJ_002903 [Wickerhamomyces pijperi]